MSFFSSPSFEGTFTVIVFCDSSHFIKPRGNASRNSQTSFNEINERNLQSLLVIKIIRSIKMFKNKIDVTKSIISSFFSFSFRTILVDFVLSSSIVPTIVYWNEREPLPLICEDYVNMALKIRRKLFG